MQENMESCSRCIMDTTVSSITFDGKGVCNYCKMHDLLEQKYPLGEKGQEKINKIIEEIKRKGKNKKHDCIVGVSGGTDSTYCIYLAKKWGLRPLAVHLDNGWNSEVASNNMKLATRKLGIDLKVIQVNWEEFKDLQIAFLKASVPDAEIPTDIGIYATLFKVAAEESIPSIINGHSFRTEGTQPIYWTYMDGRYIESVYKQFSGNNKLRDFPNLKISNLIYYTFVKKIKEYRPLEYLDYEKSEAAELLEKELNWENYGGHHYESIYTRFVTSYILMKKFNIDKRKVSLSAQARSGKMSRGDALEKLNEQPYPDDKIKKDMDYVLERLGLSTEEFEGLMSSPPKYFVDYPTYHSTIRKLRFLIKIACSFKLLPEVLYEKYAK